MYSTVSELHIALDSRLQQSNSNRKQAFHPEQYDMAYNDALLTIIKDRSSAKTNYKQEGFEQSIKRYEDLQSLKKDCSPTIFKDSNYYYFYLPSDYYSYDTLVSKILYNRNGVTKSTSTRNLYASIFNFSNVSMDITNITYTLSSGGTIDTSKFKLFKSSKSLFYYFNLVRDFIKTNYGIDCYFENFNGQYYPNSLIFVTTDSTKRITSVNSTSISIQTTTLSLGYDSIANNSQYVDLGYKKVELVSALESSNINNDYYLNRNIHLNPKFEIKSNKIYIKNDSTFCLDSVKLEYLKTPRLIDSRINQMTDMTITDEVLDLAVSNISGILKDAAYQINKTVEQQNN